MPIPGLMPALAGNREYIRRHGLLLPPTPYVGTAAQTFAFNGNYTGLDFVPAGETCYPNCDNSTAEPILNVADFICFMNEYAAGCS